MGRIGLEITCPGVVAAVEGAEGLAYVAVPGRDLFGSGIVRVHFARSWVELDC
jgi:hypothetical protein